MTIELSNDQLNNSDWVCPILDSDKKDRINKNIIFINNDLADIDKVLKPLDRANAEGIDEL